MLIVDGARVFGSSINVGILKIETKVCIESKRCVNTVRVSKTRCCWDRNTCRWKGTPKDALRRRDALKAGCTVGWLHWMRDWEVQSES